VSPLCDRHAPAGNYPQGQIGFINFVCKPVISLLSAVCSGRGSGEGGGGEGDQQPWMRNMKSNIQYWEGLLTPQK
jgi:hypothetical protein